MKQIQLSDRSLKLKKKKTVLMIISMLLDIGVPLYYAINGIANSTSAPVGEKVSIAFLALAAVVVLLLNLFLKIKLRSLIWVLLSIAYIALNEIGTMILLVCITALTNDCVIEPMLNNAKEEFKINYEIDRRNA